jgi:HEAT repeat protein
VRICAAEALWRMKGAPRALTVLRDALREGYVHDDPPAANQLYMAARALGRIGPPAREAVPDLRDLLSAEDPHLRATAAEALKRIDPKAAHETEGP